MFSSKFGKFLNVVQLLCILNLFNILTQVLSNEKKFSDL